jgi:uncharacterized RDD family membrane protein YckC
MFSNVMLKKRVYAMTMDLFIVTATNYFMMAAFTNFVRTVFFHFPLKAQVFLINKFSMMTSVAMMSLMFAYFSLFYFVTNGRTMGKTMFGLKVVNDDKSELTLVQSMKRAFAYFGCVMLGSFLFAVSYIRKDQKSLADLFSGSSVALETAETSQEKGTEFQLTLLHTEAEQNSEEAEPEYFEQNKAA